MIVRPRTLATAVADAIREAVLRGDLAQGQRLREAKLAAEYGVSRGTVREALRSLQMEGLVLIIPHRGAVVDTLTARKVKETYTLRIVLESHAVELAIGNRAYTVLILSGLRDLLSHMARIRKVGSHNQLVDVDAEFHRNLCAPCDHRMLLELLEIPLARTRMCMTALAIGGSSILSDPKNHEPIMNAVQSRNVEAARQAIDSHFHLGMGELLSRMKDEAI
jgi:DNA-binding GntR family transcriptional regulator